jgi:hypothetical protein
MSGNSLIYLDNHLHTLKDLTTTPFTNLGCKEIDWDHPTGSNDLSGRIWVTTSKIHIITSNSGIINTIRSVQNHWQAHRTCTS